MIQYIKFGQNPSFGSRDRVQTSFFGQIWHSKCWCDLENKVKYVLIVLRGIICLQVERWRHMSSILLERQNKNIWSHFSTLHFVDHLYNFVPISDQTMNDQRNIILNSHTIATEWARRSHKDYMCPRAYDKIKLDLSSTYCSLYLG